jgi:hypothetical protein
LRRQTPKKFFAVAMAAANDKKKLAAAAANLAIQPVSISALVNRRDAEGAEHFIYWTTPSSNTDRRGLLLLLPPHKKKCYCWRRYLIIVSRIALILDPSPSGRRKLDSS